MPRQYDYVMLKDGTLGCLIEDFGGGAYLFEFPTPGGESMYDERAINEGEIEKTVPQDALPNPYAVNGRGQGHGI